MYKYVDPFNGGKVFPQWSFLNLTLSCPDALTGGGFRQIFHGYPGGGFQSSWGSCDGMWSQDDDSSPEQLRRSLLSPAPAVRQDSQPHKDAEMELAEGLFAHVEELGDCKHTQGLDVK